MTMSVKIISQVWEGSQQDGSALLMLLAIADYAHDDGLVWVNGITVSTLAQKARVKERQAQNLIRQLDVTGEIYAPSVQGRGHSTRYFVKVGFSQAHIAEKLIQQYQMGPIDAETAAAEIVRRRDEYTALRAQGKKVQEITPITEKVQRSAPITAKKVQSLTRKGAIQRKQKHSSKASESVSTDPIRIDPYISSTNVEESAPRKARTRTSSEKTEKETTPLPVIQALADVCVIDRKLATKKDHFILSDAAKALYQAGKQHDRTDSEIIETIKGFAPWFEETDFRGKKGEAPTPDLVRRLWPQYIRAKERKAAPRPTPQPTRIEAPADVLPQHDVIARMLARRNGIKDDAS